MNRRVVFVTQQIDPDHPNLAAAISLVRALAKVSDEVAVVALRAVPGVLPENCRVHVVGSPWRLVRGLRFAAALARELRPRRTILVAHMSPIYAVLAAPVCRPLRIPVVLWFTHWRVSVWLRLAERVSTRIATVDAGTFPLRSAKVVSIGHGIDLDDFACRPTPEAAAPLRALAVGRTSPAKDLEAIVEAVRLARSRGVDVRLEIRGPSETDEERAYRARLEALAGDAVAVEPAVPRHRLGDVFARTDVVVNAAARGALDKSVFEACAACVPVIASNPGFAALLPPELRFARGDVEQLAERLGGFAALTTEARRELGEELQRRVARDHSAAAWAERILAAAGS
jgi:glycosyltransferase involved in cell wall biosynthesis